MKNLATIALNQINKNKAIIISTFVVLAIVGIPAYAQQVKQSNKERYAKEQQAKLESVKKEDEVAVADKPKEDTTAPKDTPAPTSDPKKTYTSTTTDKPYTKPPEDKPKPTYETVSLVTYAVQSGATINASATVGTSKAGNCTIYIKTLEYVPVTDSITVPAVSGVCHATFSATGLATGTYYVKAYFVANDSSAKGYGYSQFSAVN